MVGARVLFNPCVSFNRHSVVRAVFLTGNRNVVSVFELFSCSTEDQTQGSIHIVDSFIFFSSN